MQEKYEQLKTGTDVQAGSEADDHIFKACGGLERERHSVWAWLEALGCIYS